MICSSLTPGVPEYSTAVDCQYWPGGRAHCTQAWCERPSSSFSRFGSNRARSATIPGSRHYD